MEERGRSFHESGAGMSLRAVGHSARAATVHEACCRHLELQCHSQRSCARPEPRCGHGHFALGTGLNGQCEASAHAPLWANETSPSTNEKKVRLYFITQILVLILGNFSWTLLVTGGGMLAWSELSGRILESRGRWLAWITYFRNNVVHLQTVLYSFCLIVFEISTWRTNGEQNSYTVLSCCEVTCAWVVPFTVSSWASYWQLQCLEWWEVWGLKWDPWIWTSAWPLMKHMTLGGSLNFSGSEALPLQNEG